MKNFELVDRIAKTVLYEGYMLYPYRASSVKNRERFNFGVLVPETYSDAQDGAEAWTMQTECLVLGSGASEIQVVVRFLQLQSRQVGEGGERDYHFVAALQVGSQTFHSWREAVEREVSARLELSAPAAPVILHFDFPQHEEIEPLRDAAGGVAGVIVRRRQALSGSVEVAAASAGAGLYRIGVRVLNRTPMDDAGSTTRNDALMNSMVSVHTILRARNGEFVSLLDPPPALKAAAEACCNVGAWPVLVGEEGARHLMLSSPIILYDYPQVAPESDGDLFDGTEIDEILMLRIMTLTDDEKRQMREVDERARRILERAEALGPEQLMKLHGTLRGVRSAEGFES